MQVRVVAGADWMPGLESHLPGEAARVGPSGLDGSKSLLVVPMAAVPGVLERFDGAVPCPVVWVVPKTAHRPELERLSGVAPAVELVFEASLPAVVEAVHAVVRKAAAAAERASETRAAASMRELWEQFRDTMLERLELLEAVGVELLEGGAAPDGLAAAHAAAHKLHGSLGTFGLRRGSELAEELETLLERVPDSGAMDAGDRYRYSELVVGLRREIEAGRPDEAGGPDWPEASGTVLIVDPDPDRLERLSAAAVSRGWNPIRAPSAEAALARIRDADRPILAVLDPTGDVEVVEALLGELVREPDPVPVVLQARSRTLDARLQAVTLGARVFVDREAGADAVMARAEALLARESPRDALILAVDDDPSDLRLLTFILRGAGFAVRTLD
ncbi:MAG: Hpt domain-containing protein, partial [Gemmatimonadota bacterium]